MRMRRMNPANPALFFGLTLAQVNSSLKSLNKFYA